MQRQNQLHRFSLPEGGETPSTYLSLYTRLQLFSSKMCPDACPYGDNRSGRPLPILSVIKMQFKTCLDVEFGNTAAFQCLYRGVVVSIAIGDIRQVSILTRC